MCLMNTLMGLDILIPLNLISLAIGIALGAAIRRYK